MKIKDEECKIQYYHGKEIFKLMCVTHNKRFFSVCDLATLQKVGETILKHNVNEIGKWECGDTNESECLTSICKELELK